MYVLSITTMHLNRLLLNCSCQMYQNRIPNVNNSERNPIHKHAEATAFMSGYLHSKITVIR